jgi:HEAT repeat protein
MNQLLEWLSGGDARSDGLSNEAAAFVLTHPDTFHDLFAGLSEPDKVIRGRTADALEKVARSRPDLLVERLPEFLQLADSEQVPMVLMHVAMILGHLAGSEECTHDVFEALAGLLRPGSALVRSWSITGLAIIGVLHPYWRSQAIELISPLREDQSVAIRARVRMALEVLTQECARFLKGWIKSDGLKYL